MAELTKEQQVRALREARYKRRVTGDVTASRGSVVTRVEESYQQRCKLLEAQLAHMEAEIKWLKQQLAKPIDRTPLNGAERMRRLRAKRKQQNDE